MNTENIKQLIGVAAIGLLTACGNPAPDAVLLQPGVSRELAQFRKEHFEGVRYNLFFSIPESREEAVTGTAEITLAVREKQPVIIDFRGEPEQVASVLLNGRKVPYTVKDEHIVIGAKDVANGENRVTVEFTANDQSLNRRDEFLYTLLVPDRARTLFPCFDQPDMKSLFTLSLEVPSSWQAVANGAIEQVDSTSVTGRRRVYFRETEPLSTYLFSFRNIRPSVYKVAPVCSIPPNWNPGKMIRSYLAKGYGIWVYSSCHSSASNTSEAISGCRLDVRQYHL